MTYDLYTYLASIRVFAGIVCVWHCLKRVNVPITGTSPFILQPNASYAILLVLGLTNQFIWGFLSHQYIFITLCTHSHPFLWCESPADMDFLFRFLIINNLVKRVTNNPDKHFLHCWENVSYRQFALKLCYFLVILGNNLCVNTVTLW